MTIAEASREQVLEAYKWQHKHAIMTCKAARLLDRGYLGYGDVSTSKIHRELTQAAWYRTELTWALGNF